MSDIWIECVPNFSEGRDTSIINKIKESILAIDGVTLLDVDIGYDFNRTVVTMVGKPDAVLDAAVAASTVALENIDMSIHSGEHARMGAIDVVPFIPLSNASMETCIELANRYAKIMSNMHDLPIYLYGKASNKTSRENLPNIRKGEYEGFAEKILLEKWKPDYGPSIFNSKTGVTATGARNILIAYNVNLNTDDKKLANIIAGKIRSSGVLQRDVNGDKIRDESGELVRIRGKFDFLQAAGWMYNENTAQVSMNLLDYKITSIYDVTETIIEEAQKIGLDVISSELVGLVPLEALVDAGKNYINNNDNLSDEILVDAAVAGLKLDVIEKFIPQDNIIEWTIEKNR